MHDQHFNDLSLYPTGTGTKTWEAHALPAVQVCDTTMLDSSTKPGTKTCYDLSHTR
jgi:hypothetical protein